MEKVPRTHDEVIPSLSTLSVSLPLQQSQNMEKLVEVSDQEVKIDFSLNIKCRATVTLQSLVATCPVAFKVQTSSPHKFLVNPPSGLVPPLSHATFQLVLKPQSSFPSHFPRSPSDRFLIKTKLAPNSPESTHVDFTHETKLGVAFVGPTLLRYAIDKNDVNAVKKMVKRQKGLLAELPAEMASLLAEKGSKGWDRTEEVARLVGKCGPLDCRELYRAAVNGDRRMVEVLMEMGADPTIGWPVDVARDRGFNEVVEILEQGETVLTAARRGDSSHLERLLNQRASTTWRDQYGMTALHVAAIKGHTDAVTLLLEFKSELDGRDNEGHTPLHLAVEGGWVEIVEVLLNRGANLNAMSNKGATPLYLAKVLGYDEIYKFLSQRGACDDCTSSSSLSSIL